MNLKAYCLKCLGRPAAENRSVIVTVPLQDNNLYRFRCSAGHDCAMLLQQQRFELLAEVAARAIVDGYYREAVTSFAGCLERFMEFSCRVLARHRGVSDAEFEAAWAPSARRSERQAGLFAMAVLMEWKQPAPGLKSRFETLRNDVVHKGSLPTRDEAIEFGQAVIHLVQPMLTRLHADCGDAVADIIASNNAAALKGDTGVVDHTHIAWSMFEMHGEPFAGRNLKEELARRVEETGETQL